MNEDCGRDLLAVVVFAGDSDIRLLRWLLKPGFRHCFVALNDGRRWFTVDPLLQQIEVAVSDLPADFDLAAWYRSQGHRAISLPVDRVPRKPVLPMPATCVEVVKRVLGLRNWQIFTPWQLFRYLTKKVLTLPPEFAT